jgi:hypothetical protein
MAPLPQFNSEILTYSLSSSPLNAANIAVFDNTVYASYDSNDLRKTVFFAKSSTGTYYYKGPYSGTVADLYNGLALDEVYLIRAESLARSGDINAAVSDLNKLLSKRWKTGTYTPVNNSVSQNQLIQIILTERRKELLNRGTRWSDLKRLNKESAYATLVKRNLNGTEYTLPILDPKYVLLVPLEIMLKTTIQQNAR